ncbi:hypothetical protein VC83_01659 [Pseudogymnoascus destructans]|uniref:Tyr recombinase domain-containing protein n=1 Tax=Pseudogymnoascus destructans TaxID=655981 RepID=A0A177AJ61_9PEZI|nr:uncharacterized protein VC83_01659 [Pseudogymnoascus destructans]OAF62118.1 hypothetical protein VC83_01659 [Pseudogymnoascus destructans]
MFTFQTQLQNAEEHRLDDSVVDRSSQNQLLAREQRLDGQTHRKQLTQPSIKSYGHLEKRWREYHMDIGLDGEKRLARGSSCPTPGRLKNFIAWYAETSNGTLRSKPTQVSMKNRLRDLCAMIYQETGTKIPKALNEHYIETEFVNTHGVEDALREKDLVDSVDFFQLLQYLWTHDSYDFQHPRYRSQIAFLIQIMAYTGARPGTIVVSSAYAKSNDSLKYKVTLRLAKGRRNFARATVMTLHEDRKCRGQCPITMFLGFAFADQAFENLHPRQLGHLKIGEHGHLPLKIKETMLEVPVCRVYSEGAISPIKAVTYDVLRNQANQLGQRLGLQAVLRPYNFRRGTANAIAGKITAEQYTKLLNHTTKTSAEYYASNEVRVDSQNLFL